MDTDQQSKKIQKKICLLGDFGVGKTSLAQQFVHSIYSDEYHSTLGVKVDTKEWQLESGEWIKLVIWDIAGNKSIDVETENYLRGTAGFIFVADITREHTVQNAIQLKNESDAVVGNIPGVLLLNKIDLVDNPDEQVDKPATDMPVFITSAKTGDNVSQAFEELATRLLLA